MVYSVGALILAALGVHIHDVWGDCYARQGEPSLIASAAASPRHPGTAPAAASRWGMFRSLGALDTPVRAILIRRDARTGRWSAGDGRSPITTVPAPDLPPGTRTVPISAS